MTQRVNEIQNSQKSYNSHTVNNDLKRALEILGEGYNEDCIFVEDVSNYSSSKKKQLKKNEKRDVNESQETKVRAREEWLQFLKVWWMDSNLFHHDFPKSQNESFQEMRLTRLSMEIYNYLHENCLVHVELLKRFEDEGSHWTKESPWNWMLGHWFPRFASIDPEYDRENELFDSYIFSFKGTNCFS